MAREAEFKTGESECIIETSYRTPNARRILGLEKGDPRLALHTCNDKRCCNPAHLYIGTYHDNAIDRVKSGKPNQHYNKTHCIHGHLLNGDNLKIGRKNGKIYRRCLECSRIALKKKRSLKRESLRTQED